MRKQIIPTRTINMVRGLQEAALTVRKGRALKAVVRKEPVRVLMVRAHRALSRILCGAPIAEQVLDPALIIQAQGQEQARALVLMEQAHRERDRVLVLMGQVHKDPGLREQDRALITQAQEREPVAAQAL